MSINFNLANLESIIKNNSIGLSEKIDNEKPGFFRLVRKSYFIL